MEAGLRPNLGNFSHDFHLLPTQDVDTTAKPEEQKIRRKPVSSNLLHKPYHAIKINEEPDEAPVGGSDIGNEPRVKKGWPSEPQRLQKWTWTRYAILGGDIIQTFLPVVFLIFGISALALDRKPLSSFGNNIIAGTKIGPTIFPIIFAAVVSRLMRSIAHWKAEKGTQLGLIEQLIGSHNLTSAVQRMVLLHRYGPLGFAIVVLWLLSPLGGQSTLRLLSVNSSVVQSEGQLHYFNVNYTGHNAFTGVSILATFGPSVSALFQASLLASKQVKSSPMDLWNNVKIPMIDELSPWTEEIPGNPWIAIDPSRKNPIYASLSGLNIYGLPKLGGSVFSVETSYMQLKCGDGTIYPRRNGTGIDGYYAYVFPDGLQSHDVSSLFYIPDSYYGANKTSSLFVDTSYARASDPDNTVPLNLLYGSQLDQRTTSMTLYNCTVGTARVEAAVSCQEESCKVVRMRRSIFDTRSPLIVPFAGSAFPNFCLFLPFATGITRPAYTAPVDYYVLGSDSPFSPENTSASFADVTGDVFAKRLSTLTNTLWQASLGPLSLGLGPLAPWTDNETDLRSSTKYIANSTTARINTPVQLYHVDRGYVGIVFVVTILLQVCAVVGLVVKYMTTSPDILGYVSTQTRDNPHVEVPPGGNALDGLERARFLGEMKVQIGDVRWEGPEAGHVAFRSVRRGEEWVLGRVKKEKLYI